MVSRQPLHPSSATDTSARASFVDAMLGDLAEELAERTERDGALAARWWYVREVARSAPHLARSYLRHAGRAQRLRVLSFALSGFAFTLSAIGIMLVVRDGPPARLVAGSGGSDGILVNNVRPVQLPVHVFDAAGRLLESSAVRYRWASGMPLDVSPTGVLTCTARGDATVRASLGTLVTDVAVRCRPVREIRASIWNDFILGEPARELPVDFVGSDGLAVTLVAARVSVEDSTIATIDGLRIVPVAPGRTHLGLKVGNQTTGAAILVFEPVRSLDGLRPEQRYVAAPVRLERGDSVRWALPTGLFSLVNMPGADGRAPTLAVTGKIMCLPALGPEVYRTRCLAREPGAMLTVSHPGSAAAVVTGTVAMELERER